MRCISHQQGAATVVAEIDKNPVSKGMINIEQCRDTNTLMQSIESSGTNQDFFPFAFPFASQNTTCPQYWSRHIFSCFASKKVVAFLGFRLWIPHRAPYLVLPGSWLRCVLLAQEHVNNMCTFPTCGPLLPRPRFDYESYLPVQPSTGAFIQRRSKAAKLEVAMPAATLCGITRARYFLIADENGNQ